ncbi:MAG: hypothetical protein ACAH95_10750 [Fimbriimonas sp.]
MARRSPRLRPSDPPALRSSDLPVLRPVALIDGPALINMIGSQAPTRSDPI